MMKRWILSLVLGVAATTTVSSQNYNYLTVEKSDGAKESYVSWATSITFSGGNMIVVEDGISTSFALSELSKMYFGSEYVSAIQNVDDQARHNASEEYFDLQGRKVAVGQRESLPKGVYIVKKEGKSVKITVKE